MKAELRDRRVDAAPVLGEVVPEQPQLRRRASPAGAVVVARMPAERPLDHRRVEEAPDRTFDQTTSPSDTQLSMWILPKDR